jgi:teichuronic acid biosynthesis glycosyltransferase TuaC
MGRRTVLVTTSWPADDEDCAGHFVRTEARALEAQGHEVTVFAPTPGGAFGWPGVAARVRENPLRALLAASWVAQTARRLRKTEADAIVCHWAVPSAWPVAQRARAPVEVVSHGGDVRLLASLPAPVGRRIARIIARRCSSWRFVSRSLAAELLCALDPSTRRLVERVATVRAACIEVPDVTEAVTRLRGSLSPGKTAVTVGRLVESKRVDRVIAHVAQGGEFDKLVVVGDGPQRHRLESLARAMGVPTTFVGTVPRVEALAWIGASDALLHASVAEGLSTVVREAEALGTRVVRVA